MELPADLVAAVEYDGSADRRAWLAELPRTVARLAELWRLEVGAPYRPGGQVAWTAPARDPAGRDLVLKVGWAHVDNAGEADALRFWAGDGAVRVYDAYRAGSIGALLLERAVPGTPLAEIPEDDQDGVVAGLLTRLWRPPPAGMFRTLHTMCGEWADEFEEKVAAGRVPALDPGLVRDGLRLYRALPDSAAAPVLLCTDLHAGNIVAAQREPWLVIDPSPYVGDPAYDPVQHLLNCPDRLLADPAGLTRRLAEACRLDPERLLRWVFARSIVESIDMPWVCAVVPRLARLAGVR